MADFTVRDPDNRGDDGAPFEFTGDVEAVARYLGGAVRSDMATLSGRQRLDDLVVQVRAERTVTSAVAEEIRATAGVYIRDATTDAD